MTGPEQSAPPSVMTFRFLTFVSVGFAVISGFSAWGFAETGHGAWAGLLVANVLFFLGTLVDLFLVGLEALKEMNR